MKKSRKQGARNAQNSHEQPRKKAEHLKPFDFPSGRSGNPQGRPPGVVETVPRSFKGCLEKVFEEIEEKEGDTVYASLLEGLRAEPPRSYPYLRLLFEYRLGTPVKRVEARSKGGLQIVFSQPRGYDPLAEKSAALKQARAVPMPSRTPEYEALAAEIVEDYLPGELPR